VERTKFSRSRGAVRTVPVGLALIGVILLAAAGLRPTVDVAAEGGTVVREGSLTFWMPGEDGGTYVDVAFLLADDGQIEFTEAMAEARSAIVARFPGAVLVTHSGVTAQFVQAGYSWTSKSTAWTYNASARPTGVTDDAAAIAAAAAEWNASGAEWAFSGGGASDDPTGGCRSEGRDHRNTIGWADQPGQTLAVTCTWYTSATPGVATEFDMELDPGWAWTTGSPVQTDLQTIVLHEFGHAIGIGHTAERCPGPVMCATYNVGRTIRQLTQDDRAAILALYGALPTPVPTPTPLPTQIPIVRGEFRVIAQVVARDR